MEDDDQLLLHSLLLPTHTTSSSAATVPRHSTTLFNLIFSDSDSGILIRLLSVLLIGLVCAWANSEASKGFSLTIVNELGDTTAAGRKFDLFYVSDDRASRVVLNASSFVEKLLYDPGTAHPKKEVDHVIVRLSRRNLTRAAVVSRRGKNEFALDISPAVMQGTDSNYAVAAAVQRGMARIWLWDGEGGAPAAVFEAMVEYIAVLAGFTAAVPDNSVSLESGKLCRMREDPLADDKRGFIRRLNQAMKDQWNEGDFSEAFGYPVEHLCV